MGLLYQYLNSIDEKRQIEQIPPNQLNEVLSMFILSVRKKDGEEYEPATLRSIVSSIDRHLKNNYYPTSIISGEEFFQTRNVLMKKQKSLKKQGKGNRPNAASPLTDTQIDKLWGNGQLGMSHPESILNTLWLYNTAGFGLRGTDEHRQMCFGDIKLKTDADGIEFLEFTERSTKTRQVEDT